MLSDEEIKHAKLMCERYYNTADFNKVIKRLRSAETALKAVLNREDYFYEIEDSDDVDKILTLARAHFKVVEGE